MHTEPLDFIPLWALLVLVNAILCLSLEAGYRIGRWRHDRTPDEKDQPVGAMVGSILGLLALVLGFTFSLAAARFEARRQAVLEEANAIGTTWLRARLLPEPQRTEIAGLLREYVAVRLQGIQENKPAEAIARSEAIHEQLWQHTSVVAQKDSGSIITGVFIQSLNNLIDLHAKRILVGIRSRIPLIIWIGLYGLSILGMLAVGYQSGLTVSQRSPAMLVLVFAFAFVLSLICDLDRGQEGTLQISQQAMADVQKTMEATKP